MIKVRILLDLYLKIAKAAETLSKIKVISITVGEKQYSRDDFLFIILTILPIFSQKYKKKRPVTGISKERY